MFVLMRWVALVFCLLAAPAFAGTRVALIVANAEYAGAPLSNPTIDADLVRDALAKIGFDVTVAENASFEAFDQALSDFQAKAQGADVALFYFAGHGFAITDAGVPRNYLMAAGANVTSKSDRTLRAGGILLDEVIGGLASAAKTTLVFVDACRNDPRVSRAVGEQGRGLARVGDTGAANLFVGLSTRPGAVAADGAPGAGSPFARAFATNIGTAGARLDDAFTNMRVAVEEETKRGQSPEARDDLREPLVLVARAPALEPAASMAPAFGQSACADARAQYEEAKQFDTADAFRAFINANTECPPYTDFARLKIAAFEALHGTSVASPQAAPEDSPDMASLMPKALFPKVANNNTAPETACDRLAASSSDDLRVASVGGMAVAEIDAPLALPACLGALDLYPTSPRLLFQLGRVYERYGLYGAAVRKYRKAADKGYGDAMLHLGDMFAVGRGVVQDRAEARKWYEAARNKGSAKASEAEAKLLLVPLKSGQFKQRLPFLGEALDPIPAEAAELVGPLPEPSDPSLVLQTILPIVPESATLASAPLAVAPLSAMPTPDALIIAPETAIGASAPETECDRLAADPDDNSRIASVRGIPDEKLDAAAAVAACNSALERYPGEPRLLYQRGRTLSNAGRREAALASFQQAASLGYVSAATGLGILYAGDGQGVARDYVKAREWFETAAGLGNAVAMTNLGFLYENGEGIAQDYVKAREWFEMAASTGNAGAMYFLGAHYQFGEGKAQDYVKAREWFEKAAGLGHADAMLSLGVLYDNGWGLVVDHAKAGEWYEKAASAGSVEAMNIVGRIYYNGLSVAQDHAKAREWYEKAANSGNAEAMNILANLYYDGKGGTQDNAKAREWWKKAAGLGSADAMRNLGVMYEFGKGGPHDSAESAEWVEKAVRRGSDLARNEMKNKAKNWSLPFRKALQGKLKQAGVYSGPLDGSFGPATQKAIDAIFGKAG